MAKSLLLAWSSPTSDADAEGMTKWYVENHIPEVRAAVPSITKVTRYALFDPEKGETTNRFLAVYEIDSDDIPSAMQQLGAGFSTFTPTDLMDRTNDPSVLQWVALLPPEAQE